MTLALVSSGDGPALMIRDHLLPLVREHGTLEIQRDAVRLIALRTEAWAIEHWAPFNELSRGRAVQRSLLLAEYRRPARQGMEKIVSATRLVGFGAGRSSGL